MNDDSTLSKFTLHVIQSYVITCLNHTPRCLLSVTDLITSGSNMYDFMTVDKFRSLGVLTFTIYTQLLYS